MENGGIRTLAECPLRILRKLRIEGSLITHGPNVALLELHGGIESLQVEDEAVALGQENAGSQSTKTN